MMKQWIEDNAEDPVGIVERKDSFSTQAFRDYGPSRESCFNFRILSLQNIYFSVTPRLYFRILTHDMETKKGLGEQKDSINLWKDDLTSIASAGVSPDSKDSEGRTAPHMASANGHLGIVDFLIHNGAMRATDAIENGFPKEDITE
ncbi:ankyrin repeat family protein [Perilla frutescens var. frutescens]|nr:ankyrin repeat family protein [Perilla frutescens var. frutescens]